MKDKLEKYADLLLDVCINLKKNEPLVIESPIECSYFVDILCDKATTKGCKDIYVEYFDEQIRHDTLKNIKKEDIDNHPFWNKKTYNDYARKDSAFLFLNSPCPNIMDDIDPDKLSYASMVSRTSRPVYNAKQMTYEVAWCIAAVPTKAWADIIFPGVKNNVEKLWELLFKICYVDDDPVRKWKEQCKKSDDRSDILNKYKFSELHYTNSLGTDLYIGLPDDAIWCGAKTKHKDGRDIVVNMPTFENFTSPDRTKTNGIVYSSRPLLYGGATIDKFNIVFKDGKAVKASAEKGEAILKSMINTDENSCMLGECALVDYNSPISLTNKIFYTTLYDENASCHIALGEGFKECIKGGYGLNGKELNERGINTSKIHVDFMIGTEDLQITGIDEFGKEHTIFKDGNFALKD